MKKTFITTTIFILSFFSIYGQSGDLQDNEISPISPFNYELLNFASKDSGKTRVDEFVQVPYNRVQFVKSGPDFIADYTITVSVFDSTKKTLALEKIWNEKIKTQDFDQTTSEKNFNLSLRSFDLIPGKYFFETSIEDQDSRKTMRNGKLFAVRNLSGKYAVSDVMIIAKKTNQSGTNKIIPNISENVNLQNRTFPVFYELYSDTSANVNIQYSISDLKNKIIFQNVTPYTLKSGANQIFYSFVDSTLSIGSYLLSILVKSLTPLPDKKDSTLLSIHKSFNAELPGLPNIVKNIDEAVDQLVYIASSSEIDYINEAKTDKEKLKRYLEFWKKKDPNPSTEENPIYDEYYRRVAYANEHFSTYIKGWKTDRGMVYILLGAPNNIDRHPFDYDSKPYEVWEYYDWNRSLVFVDETGFGDYRLLTPLSGDMYRFRY